MSDTRNTKAFFTAKEVLENPEIVTPLNITKSDVSKVFDLEFGSMDEAEDTVEDFEEEDEFLKGEFDEFLYGEKDFEEVDEFIEGELHQTHDEERIQLKREKIECGYPKSEHIENVEKTPSNNFSLNFIVPISVSLLMTILLYLYLSL